VRILHERLSRDYFYKWVHHDARTGQDYIMRDILVPWRGKNYRFTFSTCLKDYVGKYLKENGEIVGKSAANKMIAIALDERDPDASIDKMLESIGEALKADKVMIFEEDEENVSATYEWKKEGVPSTIDKLQKIPREKAKALYQGYVPSEVTIINDPERMNKALKDGNISAVKINSLVSGHLAINRKSFGFVEVVNPAPDRLKDALGIAIYGMFIAIFVPAARKAVGVLAVVLLSAAISCALRYIPVFSGVSQGFSIIICAVIAAGFGAVCFPKAEEGGGGS
jgi:hypothetical protein